MSVVLKSVKDLKQELKDMGVKGYSKMKKGELILLLEKSKKIEKKNLKRIQYTKQGKSSSVPKNLKRNNEINDEIFSKPSTNFTKQEIKDKLVGYSVRDIDDIRSGSKLWVRYLVYKNNKYMFRTGGFVMTNGKSDEFVTLINVSQNYSFSVPKTSDGHKTIFFESSKRGQNFTKKTKEFLEQHFDNENKESKKTFLYTVILPDFTEMSHLKSKSNVLDITGGSDAGLSKALRIKNNQYKKHFITRTEKGDTKKIDKDFGSLSGNIFTDIDNKVEDIIDRLF